jgi:hypothetical protein
VAKTRQLPVAIDAIVRRRDIASRPNLETRQQRVRVDDDIDLICVVYGVDGRRHLCLADFVRTGRH